MVRICIDSWAVDSLVWDLKEKDGNIGYKWIKGNGTWRDYTPNTIPKWLARKSDEVDS